MRETTPSGGGWIADERSYRVNAIVTDSGDGKLGVAIEYVDEYPEFINTFAPEPCGVQIIAHTDAAGAPLEPRMFTFALMNEESEILSIASNRPLNANVGFYPHEIDAIIRGRQLNREIGSIERKLQSAARLANSKPAPDLQPIDKVKTTAKTETKSKADTKAKSSANRSKPRAVSRAEKRDEGIIRIQ
jgi:hypothetical protein